MSLIHPSSVVDQGASIGNGTQIWHFCHIMEGAIIGTDCVLGQNVFVGKGVHIGHKVRIQNNVSVYAGVHIEDEVFLGPSCVFTNILNPRAVISRKNDFLPTQVGRGASIGANATILCGNNIGKYALIGAGSVVTRPVKDYELVKGNPARHGGWVDIIGEKLRFDEHGNAQDRLGNKYVFSNGEVVSLSINNL
jgi:UDP-2-acetamido-3-amino-2,3-dideoxy-glucuronate N-acetyltransferase